MSKKLTYDRYIFGSAMLIIVVGLVMIYSASAILAVQKLGSGSPYHFLVKQCLFLLVGSAAMFVMMHVDVELMKDRRVVFGLMAMICLALLLVLFQPPINNARRWFVLPMAMIQPSELAKPILIIFLAWQLSNKEERINELTSTLLPIVALLAIPIGLILLQPDFGTAATIGFVAACLLFVSGLHWKRVFWFSVILVPTAMVILLSADYRRERLLSFINPGADPEGSGWQVMQSLIALGTGGVEGLGVGNGRQKLFFLPEPHTDFIFAIIGEEFGFIGACFLLLLFACLAWRGTRIAWRTNDRFVFYAALGFTLMIGVQGLVNISVALSLLPTKGIPLPLVSYGGSSLVTSLMGIGVLLNFSQHS